MSAPAPIPVHYVFPRSYEVELLNSPVAPHERLHQFPARLEEGDRTGIYLRVTSQSAHAWTGFFVLGFDSPQVASGLGSGIAVHCDWWICLLGRGKRSAALDANRATPGGRSKTDCRIEAAAVCWLYQHHRSARIRLPVDYGTAVLGGSFHHRDTGHKFARNGLGHDNGQGNSV